MVDLLDYIETTPRTRTTSALAVVPTYNERENLSALIPAILRDSRFDVLVVDDNSPDGSARLVEQIAREYPARVHLLLRAGKLGLGTAYRDGFRWALARDYDLICEIDADFSHDPTVLPHLADATSCADLVLGSRYVPGGKTLNWSRARRFMSQSGSTYARLILGVDYHDLTGGFKCFRRSVLETLDLDSIESTGYAFQIEMTYRAHLAGFRVLELPITFHERRAGQSKMNAHIVAEALAGVWRMRFSRAAASTMAKSHAS